MASDDTKLMLSYKLKEKEYDYWRNCRHGFNSIDQLKAWFYNNTELTLLHTEDFVLSIYDVPFIFEGDSQSCIEAEFHDEKWLKETKQLIDI